MPAYNGTFGIPKTLIFTLVDAGTTDLATSGDYTPASGDAQITIDGASAVDTVNTIAHIPGAVKASNFWSLALTSAEMSGTLIGVQISDAAVEENVLLVTTELGGQIQANTGIDVLQATNATFTAVTSAAEFFSISPNTTEEATASHYVGRNILAVGGSALRGQMTDITASSLANSKVKLEFTPMTEALASADYVVIL